MSDALPPLLIDKNIIQGASPADFAKLGEQYRLLMADVLFFEMLATPDPKERAACFRKLPPGELPIVLVDHIGTHVKEELKHQRPSSRPSERPLLGAYRFHPCLGDPTFVLPDHEMLTIQQHRRDLVERRGRMVKRSLLMADVIEQRMREQNETRPQAIVGLRAAAATVEGAREFLRYVATTGLGALPSLDQLDERWAVVRFTQAMVLFSLHLFSRRGTHLRDPAYLERCASRLDHETMDFEYLALAAHEGAFATRELTLRTMFSELRPDGLLLPSPLNTSPLP